MARTRQIAAPKTHFQSMALRIPRKRGVDLPASTRIGQRAGGPDARGRVQTRRRTGGVAAALAFATFRFTSTHVAPGVGAAELSRRARCAGRRKPGIDLALARRPVAGKALGVVALEGCRIARRAERKALATFSLSCARADAS